MSKKVYITGCLGFIGYHVTRACLKQGWEVIGVDKLTYASNKSLLPHLLSKKKFEFIPQDINDLSFISQCDVVINTAAETHVDNSISQSKDFVDSNIYGVHHLLTLITNLNPKPLFLQFSTDEVYGDIEIGSHFENNILMPSNPYSATKAAADMFIFAWNRTFGVPYTIVRPTNNYGKYQYPEKLIPCICKAIVKGEKFPLHNNGTPRRTWLHVEDTADAIVHIIRYDLRNQIFNICGNYEDSNINVAKKIVQLLTGKDDIMPYCDFGYTRVGQDVRYSVDASKLIWSGWKNIRTFDKELPDIVEFYKNHFRL